MMLPGSASLFMLVLFASQIARASLLSGDALDTMADWVALIDDRGEHTRDSCRGAQDFTEQLRCVRSPARGNRAHVPYYRAAGVEICRCNQQQTPLFVLLGDIAKKLFGDVLGYQFRQWLCIG